MLNTILLIIAGGLIGWLAWRWHLAARTLREFQTDFQGLEQRFKALFEGSPDAISIIQRDGKFREVNPSFCELTGYRREEVLGRTSLELQLWCNPLDREEFKRLVEKHGHFSNFEAPFRTKSGQRIFGLASGSFVEFEGKPHFFTLTREITALKQAENKIRSSEKRLRAIFANAAYGMVLLDPEARVTEANAAMSRLLKSDIHSLIYMKFEHLMPTSEQAKFIDKWPSLQLQEESEFRLETVLLAGDGSSIAVDLALSAVYEEDEELESVVGIIVDIRSRKQVESKILKLNEELEARVEVRTEELKDSVERLKKTQTQLMVQENLATLGALTAGIAHEIKNPLNFVNNFADVAMELVVDLEEASKTFVPAQHEEVHAILQDLKHACKAIYVHGNRADSIIRGMLLHSNSSQAQYQLVDINNLLDEFIKLSYYGMRAQNSSFNVAMETELAENLPQISGIPQELGRVFTNLLNNAFYAIQIKAQQAPENYLGRIRTTSQRKQDGVLIRIHDNGCGIPEKIIDKIFNPFFTTKPSGQGTGLGLSICFEIIVKNHGGQIDVNTSQGQFTEFEIFLPLNFRK